MKVRCINNKLIFYGQLSVGGIYEVQGENSLRYHLIDDLGRDIFFNKERFEVIKEEKEMKFKVGDKVRVREDLEINKMYGNYEFIEEMAHLKGEIVTIEGTLKSGYRIKEEYYMWSNEMFVEVKEEVQEKTFQEVIATIKKGETWVNDIAPISYIRLRENGVLDFNKNEGVNLNCKYKLQRKEYTFEEAFKAYEEGKEIESCYSQYKYKKEGGLDLYSKTESEWYGEDSFEIDEIRGKWYINN